MNVPIAERAKEKQAPFRRWFDRKHARPDGEFGDKEAAERLRLGRPSGLAPGALRVGIEARDWQFILDALNAALRDPDPRGGLDQAVSCSTQNLDLVPSDLTMSLILGLAAPVGHGNRGSQPLDDALGAELPESVRSEFLEPVIAVKNGMFAYTNPTSRWWL